MWKLPHNWLKDLTDSKADYVFMRFLYPINRFYKLTNILLLAEIIDGEFRTGTFFDFAHSVVLALLFSSD